MKTKLPDWLLTGKTSDLYIECLAGIPNKLFTSKDTSHFAGEVLRFIEAELAPRTDKSRAAGKIADMGQSIKPVKGSMMELTMAEMLVWHNLTPFALQVSMTLVPNSKFDFLCFHPTMPILFSTKFSLAERWRQAAYEGDSLKRVYRNARCYLVTAAKEATVKKINDEIDNGEIFGIDKCLGVDSDNLKQLLEDISANHPGFQVPDKIDPIKSHKKSQYVYALKK